MSCDPTSVARSCASGAPSASVIGPKTSRTSRSRIMPMAASLVSAERSMAMRRTRVSGGLPRLEERADDRRPDLVRARRHPPGEDLPGLDRQLERLGEQRFLGAEVVDDERRVDLRTRRDVADRRAVVAVLGEGRARGLEDAVAGGGLARAAAASAAAARRLVRGRSEARGAGAPSRSVRSFVHQRRAGLGGLDAAGGLQALGARHLVVALMLAEPLAREERGDDGDQRGERRRVERPLERLGDVVAVERRDRPC